MAHLKAYLTLCMQAPVLQPIELVQLPGPMKKKNLLLFATDGGAMAAVPQLSEFASGLAEHGALITCCYASTVH